MNKVRAIAVVGQTASGKSKLALTLARRLGGVIICMDSMQVYRGMDIGTAKPTAGEQALAPHRLFDIVEPSEPFAVADYAPLAERAVMEVAAMGQTPILVGGTGLYLKALMHGLSLGGVKSDERVRAKYAAIASDADGRERLHRMLADVDAEAAKRLHPNDVRRVIRALEIRELTGIPMSAQKQEEPELPFEILPIGLRMPREVLFDRIGRRVSQMMEQGLLAEVQSLLERGVPPDAQAMQGICYKELVPVAEGRARRPDAVWQIILNTRHYAMRQETWLKGEPAIRWFDAAASEMPDHAYETAEAFLSGKDK